MKKIYILLVFLFSSAIYSQTKGITYQAVILNPSGENIPGYNNERAPLTNANICLRFSIYKGTVLEYQETKNTTTDEFGMVNTIIGGGIYIGGTSATLAGVAWDGNAKNLVVEVDVRGTCSNFIEVSDQPFTYVPYAFYADNSGTPGPAGPEGPQGAAGDTGPQGPIGLTGPAGPQGIAGANGATGLQGSNGLSAYQVALANGFTGSEAQWLSSLVGLQGPQGIQGVSGQNGKTALITTTLEPSGSNCPNGGTKIEVGLDNNSDGILDNSEINASQTKYICNGVNGNAAGTFTHFIGELFGGGIIVSLWFSGGVEHGLIASLTNIRTFSNSGAWSNVNLTSSGAINFTDGQSNTNLIINQSGHTSSHAKICSDYVSGGFDDWYLPSISELAECFKSFFVVNSVLGDINGFSMDFYSSSTERYNNQGNSEEFMIYKFGAIDSPLNNGISTQYKSISAIVRAVRKF